MARIELQLAHSYARIVRSDADYALLPLDIVFEDGGAYALLGPSGCGKTTMLNIISGLVAPSHGAIRFDGVDRTRASPQERNIAQVFQFPVIYDTMTVGENLAFPLRNRKVPEDRIRERVGRIAEMLDLSAQLDQRAANLAADAKQKISLGRGLVRADVSAVLFDEPQTVIDPHLKWELRRKLKQIHHELGLTLIYVTHDQVEAMTFADQVLVMARGRVVQQGTPEELFERPRHTFVGHFIGSPGMNLLPVEARADGALWLGEQPRIPAPLVRGRRRHRAGHGDPGASRGHRPAAQRPGRRPGSEGPSAGRGRAARRRRGRAPGPDRSPYPLLPQRGARRMSAIAKPVNQKAWWLILPVILCVAFSAIIPLMTVVNYSVQDILSPDNAVFVGTEWFTSIMRDEDLHAALWRQLLFSGAVLAIEIPLGVALALSMPARSWRASAVLVIVSLSLLIPWNVVGTIWQIFGRTDIGLFGWTLASLGLDYSYVGNPVHAWLTVLLMDVWHWTPLVALLAYAGLQSIPEAYYQAASIDGASKWAVFRYIQLPKMRGVLMIAVLLRFMDSFMIYTEPFVLTGGGPGNSTTFLSQYLTQKAIGQFDMGPAAAFSLIYFLIILMFCFVLYNWMLRVGTRDAEAAHD